MGFGQAISTNLSNITNFSGRASRPEFWWWALLLWIINTVVGWFTGISSFLTDGPSSGSFLGWLIWIIIVLATIAVGARRLHDTGRSGWWQLLWFLPCIGWIILIIFWALPSTPGDNAYGSPA